MSWKYMNCQFWYRCDRVSTVVAVDTADKVKVGYVCTNLGGFYNRMPVCMPDCMPACQVKDCVCIGILKQWHSIVILEWCVVCSLLRLV